MTDTSDQQIAHIFHEIASPMHILVASHSTSIHNAIQYGCKMELTSVISPGCSCKSVNFFVEIFSEGKVSIDVGILSPCRKNLI